MAEHPLLFIFQHGDAESSLASDGIDALLSAAAFEQPVKALFTESGRRVMQCPSFGEKINLLYEFRVPLYSTGEPLPGTINLTPDDCSELLEQSRTVLSF